MSAYKWWDVSITFGWMDGAIVCSGTFTQRIAADSRDEATAIAVERARRAVNHTAEIRGAETTEATP